MNDYYCNNKLVTRYKDHIKIVDQDGGVSAIVKSQLLTTILYAYA